MTTIRLMRPSDVPALVELAKAFYAKGDYWGEPRPLDDAALASCLYAELQNDAVHAIVSENGGAVTGCIVMVLAPDPMRGGFMACKLQWIADPVEGRGSGLKLLQAAEDWARKCGANRIVNGGMSDRTIKLLRLKGYAPLEQHLHKELI
jgi:GNAT superfamily N-acetyltransferase